MTSRRAIFIRIASNTVAFMLLYNMFAVITHVAIDYAGLGYLLMAGPFFLLCWLWRKLRSPHIFLAWFVGIMAGIILAANVARTGAVFNFTGGEAIITFVVLICLRFVAVWFTGREAELEISTAVWLLAVHAGLYGAVYFFRNTHPPLLTQLSFTYLIMVLIIMLCVHMSNIEMRMVLLQPGQALFTASRAVLSANNRLIAGFVVVVLVVGGMFAFINPVQMVRFGIGGIGTLFRLLRRPPRPGGITPEREHGEMEYLDELIPADLADLELDYPYDYVQDDYLYDLTVIHVMFYLQVAAVGALIVACVIMLSHRMRHQRRARQTRDAGEETADILETSLLDDLLGLLPRRRLFRHPIRRAYAKKVNQHMRAGVRVTISDTTDAIYAKISPQEDISELTAKYERVRYGRENL